MKEFIDESEINFANVQENEQFISNHCLIFGWVCDTGEKRRKVLAQSGYSVIFMVWSVRPKRLWRPP